jgi:putative ABC transport system substrate-binding protein
MRRRNFIALLGSAAVAWPLAARAQQGERMRRIGVLMANRESDPEGKLRVEAFRLSLEKLGWTSHNTRIDVRWPGADFDHAKADAAELLRLAPDVIVTNGTPLAAELRRQTNTVPIVFVHLADPVVSGLVASLARPGGNVTGFTNFESSIGGKWVELLKEIAPGVARAALLFSPKTHTGQYFNVIDATASSVAVQPIRAPVQDPAELESAVAAFGRDPAVGLIVMPDAFMTVYQDLIITLAARHRLPAIYPYRFYIPSGGLVSYGPDLIDIYRRAASYVDRILKGEKPADLPVQQPVKFELVINLKTAKALGLTVPDKLLSIADEVIE